MTWHYPLLLYVMSTLDLLLAEVVHAPGHLPGEAQDVLLGDLVLGHHPLVQVHITLLHTMNHRDFVSLKDTNFLMTRLSAPDSCAWSSSESRTGQTPWSAKWDLKTSILTDLLKCQFSIKENAFPWLIHTPQTFQSYFIILQIALSSHYKIPEFLKPN